jgi:hydrogenase maturation protein HypF
VLGVAETSYEGQGPMMLEAAARRATPVRSRPLPIHRDESGLTRIDWEPLVSDWLGGAGSKDTAAAACEFHGTLAETIAAIAAKERERTGIDIVGLAGGVFQNALLTELAHERLTGQGFRVCLAEQIPCGDGGLSYGQVIEALEMTK